MARRVMNGRLIDVNLGAMATAQYGALRGDPISRRIETLAARQMREALRSALQEAMLTANAPRRTGNGIRQAVTGARAFGTNFSALRGHILSPGHLIAHEDGTTITPRGEYLAVPIYDGLRGDGSPKMRNPSQWRAFGSFVFKGKNGGLFIGRKPKGSDLQTLYALVPSVSLTTHTGWATNSWSRQLPLLKAEWDSIVASYISPDMVSEAYSRGLRG